MQGSYSHGKPGKFMEFHWKSFGKILNAKSFGNVLEMCYMFIHAV